MRITEEHLAVDKIILALIQRQVSRGNVIVGLAVVARIGVKIVPTKNVVISLMLLFVIATTINEVVTSLLTTI